MNLSPFVRPTLPMRVPSIPRAESVDHNAGQKRIPVRKAQWRRYPRNSRLEKIAAHDEIWISLAILCHRTHTSLPVSFLEFPTATRIFLLCYIRGHTLPLLLDFFRGILDDSDSVQKKKENVHTRNVRSWKEVNELLISCKYFLDF